MSDLFDTVDRGALFSPCRTWRYRLWRRWDRAGPALNFVMLNPSTADEHSNDPTVERCERRARKAVYGALIVTNCYALRSTDPGGLWKVSDPVGPHNDAAIEEAARDAEAVICGWGRHCETERSVLVLEAIIAAGRRPMALHINADGSPKHPLYVAYDVEPQPFPIA